MLCHNVHRDVRAQEPPAERHRQGGHLHRGPGMTTFSAFETPLVFNLPFFQFQLVILSVANYGFLSPDLVKTSEFEIPLGILNLGLSVKYGDF